MLSAKNGRKRSNPVKSTPKLGDCPRATPSQMRMSPGWKYAAASWVATAEAPWPVQ